MEFLKYGFYLLVITQLLTGCASNTGRITQEAGKNGVVVSNYNSRQQQENIYFTAAPRRVVAVWQNSVETLLALELKDRIVAAIGVPDADCIKEEYRADYRALPIVSPQNLDCENILMLEPDFILGWSSTFTEKSIKTTDFWHSRGVNTYMAESSCGFKQEKRIEDEYRYILDLGRIFSREERANQIVAQMQQEIARVRAGTRDKPKPRALILEFLGKDIRSYGQNTLAGDILNKVNGELADAEDTISYERLIEINPEVIFLVVSEDYYKDHDFLVDKLTGNDALQGVAAIKNKRVQVVPLYCVYGSATRTIDGIKLLARGLHPELYGEKKAE
ncbi:hypothetical protein P22_1456 [Propionispora sp. 2/2-37]|uniref:ABC transporter substrate-binding protein n=1 Tax=Propionispora sp. 2/2-37 TaxID=1677858 RepID=UPI0006BB6551|nr:ABC transporter substrate-binding protein [Propionispora sp. 2/2-37]CUH95386.1 hypothetical protein P22_1456 [Propionispora sp. 2/2-37]